jgi:hypothetical protein
LLCLHRLICPQIRALNDERINVGWRLRRHPVYQDRLAPVPPKVARVQNPLSVRFDQQHVK